MSKSCLEILGRVTALALALVLGLTACSHKPSGVYLSESNESGGQVCLDFKSKGKVIIRELSSPVTLESDYTIENGVVTIKAVNFFGLMGSLELSMTEDALVAANGVRFVKDTSGKTYTPMERVNEAAKAQAAAEMAKEEAAKAQAEADRAAADAAKAQVIADRELRDQQREAGVKLQAAAIKAEAEKAEAVERVKAARIAAIANLPTFTNLIVTIKPLQGEVHNNIALVRASLDGIIYLVPDSASGGCISYTNLSLDDFARFGIDTNCIAIAEERAAIKSQADASYRAIAAQQGPAAAAAFRADWQKWWQQQQQNSPLAYSARAAYEARYGISHGPKVNR